MFRRIIERNTAPERIPLAAKPVLTWRSLEAEIDMLEINMADIASQVGKSSRLQTVSGSLQVSVGNLNGVAKKHV